MGFTYSSKSRVLTINSKKATPWIFQDVSLHEVERYCAHVRFKESQYRY
jgi:hypothetical protein